MRDPERGTRITLDILITALTMIGATAWWASRVDLTLPVPVFATQFERVSDAIAGEAIG